MNKTALTLSILLLLSAALTSCGDSGTTASDVDTAQTTASENVDETTAAAYVFPEYSFDGGDFHILHTDTDNWGFSCAILSEGENGDIVNDTRFAINARVEEQFDLKLTSDPVWIRETASTLLTTVLSGDDVYKYGILPCSAMGTTEIFDAVYELTQFAQIDSEAEWWDPSVSKAQSYVTGDDLYFLAGNVSLITAEDTMCIFFNEDMVTDLGLDMLYDVVREGEWTIDKLIEYCTAAANLNGDDSFAFDPEGNAVYGISTWATGVRALIVGMDNPFTALDAASDRPILNLENDRFYTTFDKLAAFHGTEGVVLNINSGGSGAPTHYETVFKNGRSMFTCAQLKAPLNYRDMEDTFGVVPLPKFDTAQESYKAHCTTNTQVHCIPITVADAEPVAAVMDAMAYLAHSELLPAYWDINMEQKQLRNEDSIEMLGIIQSCRAFDIGTSFGWFKDLDTAINNAVLAGSTGAASIIAAQKSASEAKIEASLAVMED